MVAVRVVFMGSPACTLPVLRELQQLGFEVVGVYTAPDQPSGRGRKLEPTPVKRFAVEMGLRVYTPTTLNSDEAVAQLSELKPDVVVLAAYGKLLPGRFLKVPRWGCVNVHPSLLPRHRGATPGATAILEGDKVTGVTLFLMDIGLDTGPVLAQQKTPLGPSERTPELTARLFGLGAELLKEALPAYIAGSIIPTPQGEPGVTVSRRLTKEDGELVWAKSAVQLEREVRGYFPWPGSVTTWNGKRVQVLEAAAGQGSSQAAPGTVISLGAAGIGVVTGEGVLTLWQVRLQGKPAMGARDFLRGNHGFLGARLPS
jgi:methionyl-tRNA formyltransferase